MLGHPSFPYTAIQWNFSVGLEAADGLFANVRKRAVRDQEMTAELRHKGQGLDIEPMLVESFSK